MLVRRGGGGEELRRVEMGKWDYYETIVPKNGTVILVEVGGSNCSRSDSSSCSSSGSSVAEKKLLQLALWQHVLATHRRKIKNIIGATDGRRMRAGQELELVTALEECGQTTALAQDGFDALGVLFCFSR